MEVSNIWQTYHQVASTEFPCLKMKPPGEKPGDSYTVAFCDVLPRVPGLGKCRIEHLMEGGYVFILIPGAAGALEEFERSLVGKLPNGMYLKPRGKALGINIDVPKIARLAPAENQVEKVRTALASAERLRTWFMDHQELLAIR
jgi:hypothetical protein